MFLASALAASPAGLFLSGDERRNISAQAKIRTDAKRFAARTAARACVRMLLQQGENPTQAGVKIRGMWNDGSPRALDFPLFDADLPNDSCVEDPRLYFRVNGKHTK